MQHPRIFLCVNNMGDIFFTSDLHFYHENIIKYCSRPYSSVEQMNEILVRNWNETIGPDDVVYCMGDFSLAIRPVELYTHRLNGHKKLVPGNHDWCHPANKKARGDGLNKWIEFYQRHGWEVLPIHSEILIEGVNVNLCHLPYKGDPADTEYDHRYDDFRLVDDGRWLICGHVHQHWQRKNHMINVGVDVPAWNYKPVHITKIKEIILGEDT